MPAPDLHEKHFAETEQRETLETALKKLPANQRVPLVLYHFEEMSYEEISRQIGSSLSKVKIDIHRGREALRQKLRLRPMDGLAGPRSELKPGQSAAAATSPVQSV